MVLTSARLCLLLVLLISFYAQVCAQGEGVISKTKRKAIHYVDDHRQQLIDWSDRVWELAEPSFEEINSATLIVNVLRKAGFTVMENVGGMQTVFVATYGSAKPTVALFGEYDADPNASNKVVPRKEELAKGGYGHGGHHNLLGIGSLGAALAIKHLIDNGRLNCTIKYFGTTAEGSAGSKTYLARDGYFDDVDLSLYWHPAPTTLASTRAWDALIDFTISFKASALDLTHKSSDESTTLDAVELMTAELRTIRQQMSENARLNYRIIYEQGSLNEISDSVKFDVRIQCARQEEALTVFDRIKTSVASQASQLKIAGTVHVDRALHQLLPNATAMSVVQKNMALLGSTVYTDEEQLFTKQLQQVLNLSPNGIEDKISPFSDETKQQAMYGYASDIGDASWIAPEIYFVVKTLPAVPMHQWPGTIFSAHSIGHKGMLQASKILCMTIIDYVKNKKLQSLIRQDFEKNRNSYVYRSLLSPDNRPR